MYTPVTTNKFDRDLRRVSRRGKDLSKIKSIMETLAAGEALPVRNRDHALVGNYTARREWHIEPDWLLIYKLDTAVDEIIYKCGPRQFD